MKNVTRGYDAGRSGGLTGGLTRAVNMFGTCEREYLFYPESIYPFNLYPREPLRNWPPVVIEELDATRAQTFS